MNVKKLEILIKSPFITPLHSDTLFGHIAWAMRYLKGEEYLEKFLNDFKEHPPLIISNAFPKDYLPKPITEAIKENQLWELFNILDIGNDKKKKIEYLSVLKKLNKEKYMKIAEFEKLKSSYSAFEYYKLIKERIKDMMSGDTKKFNNTNTEKKEIVAHNVINRFSNTSENFFQQTETFYHEDYQMDIYVKFREDLEKEFIDCMNFIAINGFGKDASTGKGHFSIEGFNECKFDDGEDYNAVMSLSNFIPFENDPLDGFYNIMTKFGKLGGEYAQYPIDNGDKVIPWKKPLLMLTEGSIFKYNDKKIDYLGRMIENVHFNPKIRHYAYALVIPINLKEE